MRTIGKATARWWVVSILAVVAVSVVATQAGAGQRGLSDEPYYPAGLIGAVGGQAIRLNVSNVAATQCHARLELLSTKGIVINFRTANLDPGVSQSLKFAPRAASMVRPRVVSLNGSCRAFMASLEIVNVATGKTEELFSIADPTG